MFRLFGGKTPEFTIKLDRPEAVYFPGDTVRAFVSLASKSECKFREFSIGLLYEERYQVIASDEGVAQTHSWHTDEQWAGREIIARESSLPAGFNETYEFAWQVPPRVAASYNGEIVQIRWLVKAVIDREPAKSIVCEAPLGVAVPPPHRYEQPGEFIEENDSPELVEVKFALPRLEFVQGEEARGRIHLTPHHHIEARSIQLDLVRRERVSTGDRNATHFIEATFPLAGAITMQPETPLHFDFSFVIPPKWCPSYRTYHSEANWLLILTIDSKSVSSIVASQNLLVFNGYNVQAVSADPISAPLEPTSESSPTLILSPHHSSALPVAAAPTNPRASALLERDSVQAFADADASPPTDAPSHSDRARANATADDLANHVAEPHVAPVIHHPPTKRFCTNCGTPMPMHANFCPACGTPVFRG